MGDDKLYGSVCHFLSFKEALEQNPPILTDYEILIMDVKKMDIENMIKKNILIKPKKGRWNFTIDARTLSSLAVLNKAFSKTKMKHCISYHSSIARAKAFKESQDNIKKVIKPYEGLYTFHVSSEGRPSYRENKSTYSKNQNLV
jgi:predicted helicase